jgi:uncharacterized membrane protein
MSRNFIGCLILVTLVFIIILDVYLNYDNIPGNTISEKVRSWNYRFTWLSFVIAGMMGMLLTHWFSKPYDENKKKRVLPKRLKIAAGLLLTVAAGMGLGFLW